MVTDLIWLGFIARDIYQQYLGAWLAPETNWLAAVIFYFIYIIGILYFAVFNEAKAVRIPKQAAIRGAALGFLCYATYEFTNWAVISNWPAGIVWIDLAWGTALTAICAGGTSFLMHVTNKQASQA